jgi:hypothetical protein
VLLAEAPISRPAINVKRIANMAKLGRGLLQAQQPAA